MNNTFFKERMIFCYQRILGQYVASLENNQSYEACRDAKIKDIHRNMIRHQATKNHLVEIEPVTKEQSY